MAIEFDKTGFTVKVQTGGCPIEDWQSTCEDIITVLQDIDYKDSCRSNYYFLLELLKNMLPDKKQIVRS